MVTVCMPLHVVDESSSEDEEVEHEEKVKQEEKVPVSPRSRRAQSSNRRVGRSTSGGTTTLTH